MLIVPGVLEEALSFFELRKKTAAACLCLCDDDIDSSHTEKSYLPRKTLW